MIPRDERCVELVHDDYGVGHHQCTRKAGHGEGGRYCRQHALKHPAADESRPTFDRWLVHRLYSTPLRLVCVSETEQTVVSAKGDRYKKSTWDQTVFATREEAVAALRGRFERACEQAQQRLEELAEWERKA